MISCSQTKTINHIEGDTANRSGHSYLHPDTGKRYRKQKNNMPAGALHVVAVKRPHWLCRKLAGMNSHKHMTVREDKTKDKFRCFEPTDYTMNM